MFMWERIRPFFIRRVMSEQRKSLQTAVLEGIPATIISNLLGGPILTAYLLYLGANPEQVGLVVAIPPLANLVQILAAFYMQRFQNRKFFMVMLGIVHRCIWVSTGLIPFIFPDRLQVPVFVGMFLISFISASAGSVFWTSMIADMVPAKVRGRYFGIRNTIHWAFASLSLLASGLILEHSSQRGGFLILYAVSAICIAWNTYELLNYPNPPFAKSIASSRAGMLLKPFKDPEFMKATIFLSLFILIQNIAVPLFSFAMLSVLKISYLWVTVITSVQMVIMMISYYFWGNLNTRYASKTLLMWCLPLIAAACLLWAGMEVLPLLLVLIVVHILLGIGTGGYNLLAFNFMIGDTPKTERPMYIAIFSALTGFTGFIGPLVGGTIYNIIEEGPFWLKSYGVSFLTGAALLALAAGVGPFVLRSAKKKVT